jgi:DNA-binding response OmpR family regulator
MRVLVVEDDEDVRDSVVRALRAAGFAVDDARDWTTADLMLSVNEYDCVVLDRLLPEGDSVIQLHERRQKGLTTPVIILTALDDERDRLEGFRAGGDDYVTKPVSLAELVMRVLAVCRRQTFGMPSILRFADVEMDVARRETRRAGVLLILTPKETAVLETLLARHPTVVSRTILIEHCWDEATEPASNVVDVIIAQLRRKLGDPPIIMTRRGAGYALGES